MNKTEETIVREIDSITTKQQKYSGLMDITPLFESKQATANYLNAEQTKILIQALISEGKDILLETDSEIFVNQLIFVDALQWVDVTYKVHFLEFINDKLI
jgi:hypothetical protein